MQRDFGAHSLFFQRFPDGEPVALLLASVWYMEEVMASPMVQQITFSLKADKEWADMIQRWASRVPVEEVMALQNDIAKRYSQMQY